MLFNFVVGFPLKGVFCRLFRNVSTTQTQENDLVKNFKLKAIVQHTSLITIFKTDFKKLSTRKVFALENDNYISC